jgi:hypothetical protein
MGSNKVVKQLTAEAKALICWKGLAGFTHAVGGAATKHNPSADSLPLVLDATNKRGCDVLLVTIAQFQSSIRIQLHLSRNKTTVLSLDIFIADQTAVGGTREVHTSLNVRLIASKQTFPLATRFVWHTAILANG